MISTLSQLAEVVSQQSRELAELRARVDGIRQAFRAYRGRALQRFFRVDEELLRQCDKLKMIGTSLSSILGMMR